MSLLRCIAMTLQIFGGENNLFFFSLFFAEGNSTKRSFILNCPGAGVDCGSCCFFSLNSHVDFC